jgi:hypothetical protein
MRDSRGGKPQVSHMPMNYSAAYSRTGVGRLAGHLPIKELGHVRLVRNSRAGPEGITAGHALMADETGSLR